MKPQLFIFAACLLSLPVANATADDHTQVTYNEVSVHDPSIVASGKYYYVFGSHLGAARSADLLNWKTFGGVRPPTARSLPNRRAYAPDMPMPTVSMPSRK